MGQVSRAPAVEHQKQRHDRCHLLLSEAIEEAAGTTHRPATADHPGSDATLDCAVIPQTTGRSQLPHLERPAGQIRPLPVLRCRHQVWLRDTAIDVAATPELLRVQHRHRRLAAAHPARHLASAQDAPGALSGDGGGRRSILWPSGSAAAPICWSPRTQTSCCPKPRPATPSTSTSMP